MLKIQAEMTALRQILGTVSNGVQRNAVAVEKLKKETVQVSFHSTVIQISEFTSLFEVFQFPELSVIYLKCPFSKRFFKTIFKDLSV